MLSDPAAAVRGHSGLAGFVERFREAAGDQTTGLYLLGSPALGDFSPRQSNLDLLAVTERPLGGEELRRLRVTHRSLRRQGRDALVCYTTWPDLRGPAEDASAVTFAGRAEVEPARLANPVTWAVMAGRPVALTGPAEAVAQADRAAVSAWFQARMAALVEQAGSLLWRRGLTRLVLQASRCAHGRATGEVVSLRRAGELALPTASHTGHRVITDALGYREGANTSMYWGPFERKTNALDLVRRLQRGT